MASKSKISPEQQAIVDYILEIVELETDDDSMSQLINAKVISSAAGVLAKQESQARKDSYEQLKSSIQRLQQSDLRDAITVMQQMALAVTAIAPESGKDDLMELAKSFAETGSTFNIEGGKASAIGEANQDIHGGVGQIGENKSND